MEVTGIVTALLFRLSSNQSRKNILTVLSGFCLSVCLFFFFTVSLLLFIDLLGTI